MKLAFTALIFVSAAFILSRAYKSYMQDKKIDFFCACEIMGFLGLTSCYMHIIWM